MKKWIQALNSIMITTISLPIFSLLINYVDWNYLRPEMHAMHSASWYVSSLGYCAIALVVLPICIIIKAFFKYKSIKLNSDSNVDNMA